MKRRRLEDFNEPPAKRAGGQGEGGKGGGGGGGRGRGGGGGGGGERGIARSEYRRGGRSSTGRSSPISITAGEDLGISSFSVDRIELTQYGRTGRIPGCRYSDAESSDFFEFGSSSSADYNPSSA